MKLFAGIIFLFCSLTSFALGPIPSGDYEGVMICNSKSTPPFEIPGAIRITDDTIDNIGVHKKRIVMIDDKNFRINPSTENGVGYLTKDGLFYEITINGVLGADLYRYIGAKLEMIGSASVSNEVFLCTGTYSAK